MTGKRETRPAAGSEHKLCSESTVTWHGIKLTDIPVTILGKCARKDPGLADVVQRELDRRLNDGRRATERKRS